MTPSEPFNFGRKIKELKKLNKKGYADLTAGLKISRERIIALEEGEREPTDIERQRFAAFYNLPVEDFMSRSNVAGAGIEQNPVQRIPSTGNAPQMRSPGNFVQPQRQPNIQARPAAPRPTQSAPVQNAVKETKPVKEKDPEKDNGEPKPVMKYTAEQLGDIESAYLRKQRDLKVPLTFTFLNGKEFTGVVLDFTPFTVHIRDENTGEEQILRKLAMAYYRKADALSEKEKGGES